MIIIPILFVFTMNKIYERLWKALSLKFSQSSKLFLIIKIKIIFIVTYILYTFNTHLLFYLF